MERKYIEWRQRWPTFVVKRRTGEAADLLESYYATDDSGMPRYMGARYEAIAARNTNEHTLDEADFLAVSLLSVKVRPRAAIRMLDTHSSKITALLKQIPNRDIVDAGSEELGPKFAADQLWKLLREAKDGVGRTTTSKLIAVKRPRLIPIWDSRINRATGLGTRRYWEDVQQVLVADDMAIWKWLQTLPSQAPAVPAAVTPLRVLDVLLWMSLEKN